MRLEIETMMRSVARKFGLIPLLNRAKTLIFGQKNYEEAFDLALMRELKMGDVIYDIGANIGDYTEKFAQRVGEHGLVAAFEPSPAACAKIMQRCQTLPQVQVFQIALADQESMMPLHLGDTLDSPVSSLAAAMGRKKGGEKSIHVAVHRADTFVTREKLRAPNLIKIDVEGFEPEVIDGFGALLSTTELRAVFLEVHFTILDARGKRQAPAQIVKLLRSKGFGIRWTDASHLVAIRTTL
jgi:FkbM family methyltransferase